MPVTSLPCLWKPPKKRKESTMQMSEATFTKHTYDKTKKKQLKRLEDFDPRPLEFRGTAANHLPALLQKNSMKICVYHCSSTRNTSTGNQVIPARRSSCA